MNKENKLFNAVVIDTNAFDSKGNDFCGYFSKILPSFFQTISDLGLQLITHPVLQGETIKHIRSEDISRKAENAAFSFMKYKPFLDAVSIDCSGIIDKLKSLNICNEIVHAFTEFFSNAIVLPFTDPQRIFEKYFSGDAPFSNSGKKKSEFPDAFVIDSLVTYLDDHASTSVLVISDDSDWKDALCGKHNVVIVDTLDEALQMLNSHEKQLLEYIDEVSEEIEASVENATEEIWFELLDYECVDDLEIESVALSAINSSIVPLSISDRQVVVQTELELSVDGATTILDYDNSVWDREDHTYILTAFSIMDFKNAIGKVPCEITIDINTEQQVSLKSIRLIAPRGVSLNIDQDNAKFSEIDFETDIQGEMMDAMEEYYRH